MVKSICIIPIDFKDNTLLKTVAFYLSHTFRCTTNIKKKAIHTEIAFNNVRNQYFSSHFLKQLIDDPPDGGACKVLGICNFDLYIPIFTYVFGEAQLDGIGAVVSTCRLRTDFYGGMPDSNLLAERLIKESTHELGHTFGLTHCHNPDCVMTFSTYVEDIDEKSALFCDSCQTFLNSSI